MDIRESKDFLEVKELAEMLAKMSEDERNRVMGVVIGITLAREEKEKKPVA